MVTYKASTLLQTCLTSSRTSGPNGESEEQGEADRMWITQDAAEETRIEANNMELMDGCYELCDKC
jgi:hypothetical protein